MSTTDSVSTPAAKAPTAQPVTFLRWEWSRHAPGNPAVIVEYSVVFVRDGVAYHGYCQPLRNQPVPDDEHLFEGDDVHRQAERLQEVTPGNFDLTMQYDLIVLSVYATARIEWPSVTAGEAWMRVRRSLGLEELDDEDGEGWQARETFWDVWRDLKTKLQATA
jgi:hypothetical protein